MTAESRIEAALREAFRDRSAPVDAEALRVARLAGGEASASDGDLDPDFRADLSSIEPLWSPGTRFRYVGWSLSIAAMAAAALIVFLPGALRDEAELPRAKGERSVAPDASLHVAVMRGEQEFLVGNGGRLETGDRLGFFYSASQPLHLGILYADPAGGVVRLHPSGGSRSTFVDAGRDLRLESGAVLTPGEECEWVVAAWSSEPLSMEVLAAEVKRAVAHRSGCVLAFPQESQVRFEAVVVRR